jgi:hypothetical protein
MSNILQEKLRMGLSCAHTRRLAAFLLAGEKRLA